MLMAGVHALASLSPALHNPEASLLPDLADVRSVSVHVAAAVVRQAVEDGNASDQETIDVVKGKAELGLEDFIRVSRIFYIQERAWQRGLTKTESNVGRRVQASPACGLDSKFIGRVPDTLHIAIIDSYALCSYMYHTYTFIIVYSTYYSRSFPGQFSGPCMQFSRVPPKELISWRSYQLLV